MLRPFERPNQRGQIGVRAHIEVRPDDLDDEAASEQVIGVRDPRLEIVSETHSVESIIGDDYLSHEHFKKHATNASAITGPRDSPHGRIHGASVEDKIIAIMTPKAAGGRISVLITAKARDLVLTRKSTGMETLLPVNAQSLVSRLLEMDLVQDGGGRLGGRVAVGKSTMTYRPVPEC